VDRLCSSTHVTSSNTKICSSALSLLPEILFDSLGLIKSSHQLNMLAMSSETKPTGPLFGVQLDTGHSHPARSTGSTTASEERRWK
jgi:hypothetical protein